tara:strand:- start:31276 stop:32694 length:1419 start_codon:yes stop_codon:yes gene_type:complete
MPRNVLIISVSGGSVYNTTDDASHSLLANGAHALAVNPFAIQSVAAFRNLWYVDGTNYKYVVGDTATVKDWEADMEDGTALPSDNDPVAATSSSSSEAAGANKARLIDIYRGRIVLAGTVNDPQNWHMLKVDNPLNNDVSPPQLEDTRAVSGNNSRVGLCPDAITGIIPWSDDTLFFGCDHSIWMMRGDPASGGSLDRLSNQTGMAWGRAWCQDPRQIVYFFGSSGIFRMSSNGQMDNLTKNRLDKFIESVDLTRDHIQMQWNRVQKQCHIFITKTLSISSSSSENISSSSSNLIPLTMAATETTHLVWDERTDSFWFDQYPVPFGPVSSWVYDADNPEDRKVLIGCWDGRLRKLDKDAVNDDTYKISTHVDYPPINLGGLSSDTMMSKIYNVMSAQSNEVSVEIRTGTSAEVALASSPVYTGQWAGASTLNVIRQRIKGNTVVLRITHAIKDQRWAVEKIERETQLAHLTR